ncbi:MAG TPA: hypothetical protein VMW28_00350 [Pelolinea sp.]|nr:hypothetical protein [Pelolinea sp.]
MDFSIKQKARIFDEIYQEYIKEHGLGGMSKTDLNALILYLFVSVNGNINSFDLSNEFKITESQIKSLLEKAAVKFDKRTIEQAWSALLIVFERVEYDVESLEKGQIRFQLSDPMLFRWLQDRVRTLGSTCTYSKSSEQVNLNLETLYRVMDFLWKDKGVSENWSGEFLEDVQTRIQKIIGNISMKIEKNMMEDLRKRKQPKLLKILEVASQLARIGSLILPLVKKI